MREYTKEEQEVIDYEINNLDSDNKLKYLTMYKEVKSEYTVIGLAIVLGIFGGPIIYLKNKNLPSNIILSLVANLIFMLIMIILILIFSVIAEAFVPLIIVCLILGEFGFLFYAYVYNSKHYIRSINYYNYNQKVRVLKYIHQK